MTPEDLEVFLHEHIPLSKAMGVGVVCCGRDKVVLRAPLEPNINHRQTVFGGSASALAILSAWSLLHVRLLGQNVRIVIQENTMSYIEPIEGDFTAVSEFEDGAAWARFLRSLERRGIARTAASSRLLVGEKLVGRFEGKYVAVAV